MKAAEVRATFLDFFAEHGHAPVRSASLVPAGDPTLLFTNAGMVPFKELFTGRETRDYKRATSSQKCVRAGGKHNDLDEVGKTARHHTFFEMLGNFSFGDYFKEDAIGWAWTLLTDIYGIDKERLIVTVHRGDEAFGLGADDEARALWRRIGGLPEKRILGLGSAENFWMMGETGPMGPCSEIHYYLGDGEPRLPGPNDPEAAWADWLEIWNLVFMQYERREPGGPLLPLPAPSIDTGAGLERVASVLQGARSNYDTDLFTPLLAAAADAAGTAYGADETADISMRVIADHARAATFLIADGVFPDKTNREYVLRRIFRRAVRHGKLLGIDEPFMHRVCARVIDEMGDAFPELRDRRAVIHEIALEEEKRFRATLNRGLGLLEEEFAGAAADERVIKGAKVFQLYDTFGFPDDLTEIIAAEHGFSIDRAGYERELQAARERSSFGGGSGEAGISDIYRRLAESAGGSRFLGYEGRGISGRGRLVALAQNGEAGEHGREGDEVAAVFAETPFYGESGGQMGDSGVARGPRGEIAIEYTVKPDGQNIIHLGKVIRGEIAVGEEFELAVDDARRQSIRANHSATHLLHLALKRVLGDHVAQKGSLVAPERLRFDFSHFSPMTGEQLLEVEDRVNAEIRGNGESQTEVLPADEARERGAVAMFGEKYGATVRVVRIGGESLEFCGGTHVERTGDIGLFKILSESGIAQGVRRIEAVTGAGALDYLRLLERELSDAADKLRAAPLEVAQKVAKLQSDHRQLERDVAQLKQKLAAGGARDLMGEVKDVGGIKVLATTTEADDAATLRATGDRLRDKLGSGVVLLAGTSGAKVNLVAMVTKDLTARVHAGKLLKVVAEVLGGRGGGRPDMAQGGGASSDKLPQALEAGLRYVSESAAAGA